MVCDGLWVQLQLSGTVFLPETINSHQCVKFWQYILTPIRLWQNLCLFIAASKCNSSHCKQFCAFCIHSLFTSSSSCRMLSVRSSSVRGLLLYVVLPLVLLQPSCCPKLVTVRREGCKDGCFWTTVPPGSLLSSVTASTWSGVSS